MTDYHQDKLAMMMMVTLMLIFQRVPVEKINDIQLVLIEEIFGQIELSIQPDLPRPPQLPPWKPIVHKKEATLEGNL